MKVIKYIKLLFLEFIFKAMDYPKNIKECEIDIQEISKIINEIKSGKYKSQVGLKQWEELLEINKRYLRRAK